jgi:Zn-dependent M28 family amino/carboxypeptidase
MDSISPGELRMHLEFLASEELGGRYTLAPNFPVAARYLAAHLEAYGFRGAGEHGDFLQHFSVISSKPDIQKTSLSVTFQGHSDSYSFGDFYPAGVSEGKAEGQIVFVGYGISSPSQKHDDYANLDVKGKIVLVASGMPEGVDLSSVGRDEEGERAAAAHGAVGVLQLPSTRFAEFMKRKEFKERAASRETVRLAKDVDGALPVVVLAPDLAQKLLSSLGLRAREIQDAQAEGNPLAPKATDGSATLIVAVHQHQTFTQNVVGVLKGTDPVLRQEYIAISAHYDHLQTNEKGEIYPGADDDGSGTTSVLAVAHAMAMDRPKRSVLVIFHAGEELGLLGSKYNTDYAPVVPLDKIVADLNIDMIGRSKPADDHDRLDEHLTDANSIYLVGSNRISKELHKISEETNSDYQKLRLDYYYNDPANPERIYFRSDHWNYAKHGIPVIFYFDGTHVDYHRPTDTIDKIDFDKMTKVARLVFETGWRLANLDHTLAKDAK